jgi:LPXTG-motif cell wall-anchored protein
MKKLGIVALGSLCLNVLAAASALAQDSAVPPPGNDNTLPNVVVHPPGGTAFTGSEVTVWMVLAVALLVGGIALLIAARRRARTSGSS